MIQRPILKIVISYCGCIYKLNEIYGNFYRDITEKE